MEQKVVQYKAESLEDIAAFLEKKAAECRAARRPETAKAYAYMEIADLLRRTTIEPPKKPRWLKIGEWVTEVDGLMRTGNVSNWDSKTSLVRVQFGSSGPFEMLRFQRLRPADANEIKEVTGGSPGSH